MPDDVTLAVGPVLRNRRDELLRHHIESQLFLVRRAAAGMERSARAKASAKYRAVQQRIAALEEMLVW